MRFLFPADPLQSNIPDEAYAEEFQAAQSAGLACSLYSAESMAEGRFKARPALTPGDTVLYRGWMLSLPEYGALEQAVAQAGAQLLTTLAQYQRCHHLPQWYPLCQEHTPATVFTTAGADYAALARTLPWRAYFVKDYVKSLTTSRTSIARTPEEIGEIVALIQQYRGQIEGGICIREFEALQADSEERYFVWRGKAYARSGAPPALAHTLAQNINSPFFSIDLSLSEDGRLRLIELGDGQVSDRKQWPLTQFMQIFSA